VETMTATVTCRQLRDLATRTQRIFIFAGVHDYFIHDLWPNAVVIKSSHGPSQVIWHDGRDKK
jgi:hypothetical protein